MKKKILWLTTGGTIASEQDQQKGLSPHRNCESLKNLLGNVADNYNLFSEDLFSLDSSNIQPEEWQLIARCISERMDDFDGIILTHGTDTMAYTAAALSFMLQNIPLPLVISGSQLPLSDPLSDGIENIRCALAMASSGKCGVYIAFDRKIILGTRAVKVRTLDFDAYESVNMPFVGEINSRGLVLQESLLPPPHGPFRLQEALNKDVILLKLIPGLNPMIFDALTSIKAKGVVIEAFGIGGISFIRRDITQKIQALIEQRVSVVVCSQCLYESSDFSVYEVGKKALAAGVIQAHDMTSEAAVTKLMWALGQSEDPHRVKQIFETNYVNEIDPNRIV